ncbi:MAG TPA: HAMP domain-containing sensor histidine kinase [Candidatus Saccharimonadales bacterium]|nr:HAMP domain-containing sensor histidine kinase [Candidatus Saccharimonadales bacterium]
MHSQTEIDTATVSISHPDNIGYDRLSELERFAEIGRLSVGLLHEISSPLSAALLWLEQCNGPQSPYMRHVRSSMSLLKDYVEAARQQVRRESPCREFHVRSELERVWSILAAVAARRGVSLDFAPAGNYKLHGDPIKFQQILANLVRNAIDSYDSCPAGGHKPVRIRFRASRGYLVTEVADRGCGITRDQFDKLFQPFYSTKAGAGKGLGIGLFSVKRSIEEDFRGDVSVSSLPGQGTRFIARFSIMPGVR